MPTETNIKTVNEMTRKEIESVPDRAWQEDIGEFDAMIILPTRRIHDSGFRCMDFVAVKKGIPVRRLSGCSDVIHINGIGGYGNYRLSQGIPSMIEPISWSIDCLKKSGLLQIFSHGVLTCGTALSSFEVFHHKQSRQPSQHSENQ